MICPFEDKYKWLHAWLFVYDGTDKNTHIYHLSSYLDEEIRFGREHEAKLKMDQVHLMVYPLEDKYKWLLACVFVNFLSPPSLIMIFISFYYLYVRK